MKYYVLGFREGEWPIYYGDVCNNHRDILACVSVDGAPMVTETADDVPHGEEETSGLNWCLVPVSAIPYRVVVRECGL